MAKDRLLIGGTSSNWDFAWIYRQLPPAPEKGADNSFMGKPTRHLATSAA
jgi:hypothetical protein